MMLCNLEKRRLENHLVVVWKRMEGEHRGQWPAIHFEEKNQVQDLCRL